MEKLSLDSEVLTRAIEDITTREELKKRVEAGKKLRIKFGVDVTAPTLHIGNAVNLWKMREFQEYGHVVVFLIGDFTTKIGDPTGRLEARKKAAAKNIDSWAKNFIKEIGQILRTDKKVFEVRRNSEWYDKMRAEELIGIIDFFTHAKVIERDMFQRRIREGREIRLPELIYPILQGYDSVMLKSDLTIIGSDQLFNENIGRFLQEKFGQEPQVTITTVITPGLDGGSKMSKSLGNYIGLDDSPTDKFGKAMRLLDHLIVQYLKVYTQIPLKEIEDIEKKIKAGANPMGAKLFFAEALVQRYHGAEAARKEKEKFLRVFSKRDFREVPSLKLSEGAYFPLDLLIKSGLVSSRSEGKRLIKQGAVDIGGRTISSDEPEIKINKGMIIKVGKRKIVRVA